jgi:uncharacterized protein (TIGR03067 family)
MRWTGIGLILGCWAACLAAPEPDAAEKDLKALQGAWVVESLEYDGEDVSRDYPLALTFQGAEATLEGNDDVRKEYAKIAVKLDAGTQPKGIDVTVARGTQKGLVLEGIYEVDAKRLRLCVKVVGKDRPSAFKAPAGAGIALVTLKRKE